MDKLSSGTRTTVASRYLCLLSPSFLMLVTTSWTWKLDTPKRPRLYGDVPSKFSGMNCACALLHLLRARSATDAVASPVGALVATAGSGVCACAGIADDSALGERRPRRCVLCRTTEPTGCKCNED